MTPNNNIVPRVGNNWITLRLKVGAWEIPGSTLEAEEDYLDKIFHELREEEGAKHYSFQIIGACECFSLADKPYRSHLPFAKFFRVPGIEKIRLVSSSENPPVSLRKERAGLK